MPKKNLLSQPKLIPKSKSGNQNLLDRIVFLIILCTIQLIVKLHFQKFDYVRWKIFMICEAQRADLYICYSFAYLKYTGKDDVHACSVKEIFF